MPPGRSKKPVSAPDGRMQNADSPMEPEMALFQKALPMLMSKRGKRGRNESVVDFATCVLEEWGEMPPPHAQTEKEKLARKAHMKRVRTWKKSCPEAFEAMNSAPADERPMLVDALRRVMDPVSRDKMIAEAEAAQAMADAAGVAAEKAQARKQVCPRSHTSRPSSLNPAPNPRHKDKTRQDKD